VTPIRQTNRYRLIILAAYYTRGWGAAWPSLVNSGEGPSFVKGDYANSRRILQAEAALLPVSLAKASKHSASRAIATSARVALSVAPSPAKVDRNHVDVS
jgi:hypothetical protein